MQEELFSCIQETGTPVVYVHMDIKPLSSLKISEKSSAVLENWFPGETGGRALADVLFGDYNPAGRLPITVPHNAGQIPIYSGQRNGSGYRPLGMTIAKYVEGSKTPLYPLGYGLSYTEFAYSDLFVTPESGADGVIEVSVKVKNCGKRDGEEVVQVYVTDELASMLRPAQELAGFHRMALKVGEAKKICFTLRVDQFAFLDRQMDWIVEAGDMTVKIGRSSADICLQGKFVITDTARIDGKKRGFYAMSREMEAN